MCEVNEAIAFNSLEKLLANDGTRTGNNKFVILIKKKNTIITELAHLHNLTVHSHNKLFAHTNNRETKTN